MAIERFLGTRPFKLDHDTAIIVKTRRTRQDMTTGKVYEEISVGLAEDLTPERFEALMDAIRATFRRNCQ